MSSQELENFFGEVLPEWPRAPTDPPGNFYARELKRIHDGSKEVLPESAHRNSRSRRQRWKSVYKSQYIPLGIIPEDERKANKPRSAPDLLAQEAPDRTFMQWKVPERLTADPAKRQREPDTHDTESLSSPLAREYRKVMPASARDIPTPGSVLRRERTMFPAINRTPSSMSKITETSMPKSAREPMMSEPVKAPTPQSRAASRKASAAVQKPKTQIKPSKTFATQNVLKAYNQPDITSKAEDFLRTAPDHQRHLVEKTLKLAGKAKSPPEKDDQEAIYKWMKTATEKDRQVALKFFQSMLGSQLLGSASDEEQSKRVQHVIKVLEKGRPFGAAQAMDRPAERETRLRYIRLLTPGTRSNRWMHTTWHHLPNYNDVNPVYNKSSIYTQPHAPVHRHFKIHPDWGP